MLFRFNGLDDGAGVPIPPGDGDGIEQHDIQRRGHLGRLGSLWEFPNFGFMVCFLLIGEVFSAARPEKHVH